MSQEPVPAPPASELRTPVGVGADLHPPQAGSVGPPSSATETAKPTRDSELEVLREAAEISRKAADGLSDQLKHLTSDFEAFRRRVDREKQERFEHGREEVLLEIVGLWDNLEQALAAARAGADLKAVVTGLELIQKEFEQFFRRAGVSPIAAVGEAVNPDLHEVLEHEVRPDGEDGVIVAELKRGYRLGQRVLRPAMVKVSKKKTA